MGADEDRFGPEGDFDGGGIDPPLGSDWNLRGSEADRFEPGDGRGDGGLLRGAVNNVASAALVCEGSSFNGEINRFCAVGREEDIVRGFGVEQRGALRASFGDG